MTVLFWDIDGTLLTTGKAGVPAWEAAVAEATGRRFELASVEVTGRTDFQIARATFERLDVPFDDGTLRHMIRRYEELLPSYLPLKQGRVLPNVREILDELAPRPDVRSYLLTGNTRGGARAKLTHYQLHDYFADGAFAEDFGERATIAQRALALARRAGPVDDSQLFVIGDTPHDITCAAAIGARTIAVGTGGGYTVAQLEQHQPWRAFPQLPAVAEFVALIDHPVRTRVSR
jgi:phosphoglycolate phosphatase-like HAD superfamily hydrolase